MELLWSAVIGLLFALGTYLLLERHLLRFIFGLIIFSNAINLTLLFIGRLTPGKPAFIESTITLPKEAANSVPQALILTAIVIGFGLLIFTLVLIYKVYQQTQSLDMNALQLSEKEDS